MRTASGLALASLATAAAVMAGDGVRSDDVTATAALDSAVLVIEDSTPAPQPPSWWECAQ